MTVLAALVRVSLLAWVAIGVATHAFAQQAPAEAGTGTISGVITDAATEQPIAGAIVYLGPPSHGPPGAPIRQMTDGRGRFVFTRLPAFDGYFIQVSAGGYFRGYYGTPSGGSLGSRIALADGEWYGEADVALERPSAVSGLVLDERGEPLVGVYVRALPRYFVAGQQRLVAGPATRTDDRGLYRIGGLTPGEYAIQVPAIQATVPASVFDPVPDDTNARPFTAPSIDPSAAQAARHRVVLGEYLTPLPPVDGRQMAYPLTFFPGTSSPRDAVLVQLGSGEERAGVDVRMVPVVTYTVSGRLDGPPGAVANVLIRALPPGVETLGQGAEVATTISDRDGSFTFFNVPAGAYTLLAHNSVSQYEASFEIGQPTDLPMAAGTQLTSMTGLGVFTGPDGMRLTTRRNSRDSAWRGSTSIRVDGADVGDVVIPIDDGATISGRFVWDVPANAKTVGYPRSVRFEPANGDPTLNAPQQRLVSSADQMTADTFSVDGLLAGQYVMEVSGVGAAARIKSITWNGQDYTGRAFDASSGADITDVVVTLTSSRTRLEGTVRSAQGGVVEKAAVIVFPVDAELRDNWGFTPERVRAVMTTTDGGYAFTSLPEGRYFAVAVDASLVDAWQDPAFLERAAVVATQVNLAWDQTLAQNLALVAVRR